MYVGGVCVCVRKKILFMNSYVFFRDCISNNNSYIGHTCTTLSRRLTCHLFKSSAIPVHMDEHMTNTQNNINIKQILVDDANILDRTQCKEKLKILEAVEIKEKWPALNMVSFSIKEPDVEVYLKDAHMHTHP